MAAVTGRKLGLFGGSFDPVHLGHLIVAQDALEQLLLDEVCFIPAAQAPLKDNSPIAPDALRLAMIQAAIEPFPQFSVIADELQSGGVSYTINTIRRLSARFPHDRLYWIIGGDHLAKLEQWHEMRTLCELVEFICLHRPGHSLEPPESLSHCLRLHPVEVHAFDISSTEIRERIQAQKPVDFFLAEPTLRIIQQEQTYQNSSTHTPLPEDSPAPHKPMIDTPIRERTLQQIALCVEALEDRKAEDIRVLNVTGKSTVTDYLIIATGTSDPHLKALRRTLDKALSEHDIEIIGRDRSESSGWLVVDGFDFMVHLFTEEQREHYQLEFLWKDAIQVDLPALALA